MVPRSFLNVFFGRGLSTRRTTQMFTRRQQAQSTRENAADLAANRPHPRHINNAEEHLYRKKPGPKIQRKVLVRLT